MNEYSKQRIEAANAAKGSFEQTMASLRKLTLDEYGELLISLPNEDYPHLSDLLPGMASEQVQTEWTGSSGTTLLRQTVSFMNFVVSNYTAVTGKPFHNINVLDFGCGWGRILRLLSFYNDPQYCFGCDAWKVSLEHSRANGMDKLVSRLEQSEPVPDELPFAPATFDLVYAFSIFTHLSEPTAIACMDAIRKALKPDGVAIITIRPPEFWDYTREIPETERSRLMQIHRGGNVAFYPSLGKATDPSGKAATYGDAGIPLESIEKLFDGWKVVRAGTTLADMYQLLVVLRPTKN